MQVKMKVFLCPIRVMCKEEKKCENTKVIRFTQIILTLHCLLRYRTQKKSNLTFFNIVYGC